MNKRIKWIVGVGVLAAVPFVSAAPASAAGVGGCTTATLGIPVEDAALFLANCYIDGVGHCTTNYDPIDAPVTVSRVQSETTSYALCLAL